jgi:hypothetical protein
MNIFFIAEFLLAHFYLAAFASAVLFVMLFLHIVEYDLPDEKASSGWIMFSTAGLLYLFYPQFSPIFAEYGTVGSIALISISYLVIGCLWSLFKWNQYLGRATNYILRDWNQYSQTQKEMYSNAIKPDNSLNYDGMPTHLKDYVKPSQNTGRFATWLFYWPVSIVSYVIQHFLADIASMVFNAFKGIYEKMTRNALKNVKVK